MSVAESHPASSSDVLAQLGGLPGDGQGEGGHKHASDEVSRCALGYVARLAGEQHGLPAAAEIERRCGPSHFIRAVEMRTSMIYCSLAAQTECPSCGAVGVKINRQTGMRPLCTERYRLEQERAFNEQLETSGLPAGSPRSSLKARREGNKMRQRNSRLCRKYGLKGKQERRK